MNPAVYHALIRSKGVGPALARFGLGVAALPYGLAVRLRNRRYDRGRGVNRAAVRVVSIGNLTLGGTGKTPCVELVARFYADIGLRVAILSRGYGAATGRNDEAMVLEENLPDVPHLQGADRVALATAAVEELESEVLVLDDGFQHRRLGRDLDIVLADATWPLSRERLFPAGMLREPVSGLGRAGVVLLTRCDVAGAASANEQRDWIRRRHPQLPVFQSEHAPLELVGTDGPTPLGLIGERPVAAFCGLGNPDGFRKTLDKIGRPPAAFRTFPDHHPYTRADVEELREWAAKTPSDTVVLTTQKDFVKLRLPDLAGRPLWAVRIGFRLLDGETEFAELLRAAAGR